MPKLRVAIVTPDYYPDNIGGCGISAFLFSSALRKQNIKCDVFSFDNLTSREKQKYGKDYRYKAFPKIPLLNNLIALIYLYKVLNNYDIVQTYNMDLIPVCALLKNKYKLVAIINNPKGALPSTYGGYRSVLHRIHDYITTVVIKFFKNRVDHYISLSLALKEMYIQNGYQNEKISVIPNMIDDNFLRNNIKTIKYEYLYVGQLSAKKGLIELLDAFKEVQSEYKHRKLLIVGDGGLDEYLHEFIAKNKLKNNIIHKRIIYSDLPEIYSHSLLLVHPAKWHEPFSRVWLEAIASNTHLLSTKNPGAIEYFKDYFHFYNSNQTGDLVEKMKNLPTESNAKYSSKLIDAFSAKRVVDSTLEIYNRLLS